MFDMANGIQLSPKSIIPQLVQDWQTELARRTELLDAEWQQLQMVEVGLRQTLDEGMSTDEHDLLFLRLGQVWQRMTEVMLEIEHGPHWILNGHGGEYDK